MGLNESTVAAEEPNPTERVESTAPFTSTETVKDVPAEIAWKAPALQTIVSSEVEIISQLVPSLKETAKVFAESVDRGKLAPEIVSKFPPIGFSDAEGLTFDALSAIEMGVGVAA